MTFKYITVKDLLAGVLKKENYSILCLPGGYACNWYDDQKGFGNVGEAYIKEFVFSGGGFVGICAGAYIGSKWGLGLIDVSIRDEGHWNRGKGRCNISFT